MPFYNKVYEMYKDNNTDWNIFFVDFFVDGTNSSNYGAQSETFQRLRLNNIKGFTENWYNICISPSRLFSGVLAKEKRC